MKKLLLYGVSGMAIILLAGCSSDNFSSLSSQTKNIFKNTKVNADNKSTSTTSSVAKPEKLMLNDIAKVASASADWTGGFQKAIKSSVETDPVVLNAKAKYQAKLGSIDLAKTSREFKFSGSLLTGVEDVTDETAGAVAVINGRKIMFDGGKIDSQISREEFLASAALAEYEIRQNERASNALSVWVNLKRYSTLNELIQSRLNVLAPLIQQLEKVAEAGLGDASQVAAAERTVNMIRVTEKEVAQQLAEAEVGFESVFGVESPGIPFEGEMISNAVDLLKVEDLVKTSPGIELNYAQYGAAVANLNSIIAKYSFDVGFETKIQKPLGGSGYDSDESIGFVISKTFHDGGSVEAEKKISEAQVTAAVDLLKLSFREIEKNVKQAETTISAITQAIELANENAKNAKDEINFLRKQLIIGQSTLDNVLSAEARLYEAESMAINFVADRYLAEITILTLLGELVTLFDIE